MKALHISLCVLALCVLAAIAILPSLPLAGSSVDGQLLQSRDRRLLQASSVVSTTLAASYPLTITAPTIFVPVVAHNYRPRPPCTPDSPFGLQIAALHEVQPPDGGTYVLEHLTEAEWLALYEEAFPTLVEALEASGACWARLRVAWAWIQPEPPPADYVWGPYHDEKLALVAETGVRLIAHIDDVPYWAGPASNGPIDEDHLPAFAQFLTDVVNRYKQPPYNIHTWEMFNEPDFTSTDGERGWGQKGDEYARMLAWAYAAIKLADPEAAVLMGGLAYDWFTEYGGPFYRYFPDDVMAAGGADYLDALNIHYFPGFSAEWERWVPEGNPPTCGDVEDGVGPSYDAWGIDVIAKANHFRNRMYTCHSVDKPVWLTETGQHGFADDPVSLAEQARYVIQVHARGLAAGLEKIVWYALVSPPYDSWGQGLLYQSDWSPKPAFHTYQTLTYELSGYEYASTLDVPDVEGYTFSTPYAQDKTVVWGSDDVLIGGLFSSAGDVERNGIARLDTDGALDASFDPGSGANGVVHTMAVQPDRGVLIGGEFTSLDGVARNRIARLDADGALDASFDPGTGADDAVKAAVLQSDTAVLIGGLFTTVDGTQRRGVARLKPHGSLDTSFDTSMGADGGVEAIAVQPDGRVIIGGQFSNVDGVARNGIARLDVDGSLDISFDPGAGTDGTVYAVAVQPDGKVLIGGSFDTVDGTGRGRVARLNADGALDASFDPGPAIDGDVFAIAVQADGRVVIGGSFTQVADAERNRIARLDVDGSLDTSFRPGSGADSSVQSVAVQADGKVLIGGCFTSVRGVERNHIAELNANGSLSVFNPGGGVDNCVLAVALQPDGELTFAPARRLRVVDRQGTVTIVDDGGTGDADETQNNSVRLLLTVDPVFVSTY